jgi:hypothetical protein
MDYSISLHFEVYLKVHKHAIFAFGFFTVEERIHIFFPFMAYAIPGEPFPSQTAFRLDVNLFYPLSLNYIEQMWRITVLSLSVRGGRLCLC